MAYSRRIHRRRGDEFYRSIGFQIFQKWNTSVVLYVIMTTLASATLLFSTIIFFEFNRKMEMENRFVRSFVVSNDVNRTVELQDLQSPPNFIRLPPSGGPISKSDPVTNSDDARICLSPEKDVPWILNGQCTQHPYVSSFTKGRTCGFCGGGSAAYLSKIRDDIAEKFQEKCNDLVVYGAALGKHYEQWLNDQATLGVHHKMVADRHGTCFFQFVTTQTNFEGEVSADGSQILIHLESEKLPYKNNRRNTKLLKLSPGLLFPWAKRIIWQDTKLLLPDDRHYVLTPSNYHRHFNRTVQRFGSCVSFMGMPHHPSAVGINRSVTLDAHCQEIVRAAKKRPTVSDNLQVVLAQCQEYKDKYKHQMKEHLPMIDTAFIVWDMRRTECQHYIGKLTCSWLDEIHCYSDRDQVSFPSVIASSQTPLSLEQDHRHPDELDHRVYVNANNTPMVHIAKRSCHWYYRSFSRCVGPKSEVFPTQSQISITLPQTVAIIPPKPPRVAVVVAGTLQRFMFRNTIDYLIRPLVKKSALVDYYLFLTTSAGTPYRATTAGTDATAGTGTDPKEGWGKSSYLNHIQVDPLLPAPSETNTTSNPMVVVEEFLRSQMAKAGASIGELIIQESIDLDSEPMLRARRERAKRDHPEEDVDLRFPIFDIRSEEIGNRTANANRNLLRLHFAVERLWESLVKWEEEEGFEYDYVMFLRDDTLWLSPFHLDVFESMVTSTSSTSTNSDGVDDVDADADADIFVPACDARDPPMDSHELNDHAIISRRRKAEVFGRYYSTLLKQDEELAVGLLEACMSRLPSRITSGVSSSSTSGSVSSSTSGNRGRISQMFHSITFTAAASSTVVNNKMPKVRGCNSEMLLKWVTEVKNVRVKKVGQGVIPFQRSVNVKLLDGSIVQCFHKFCQSIKDVLVLDSSNAPKKCMSLTGL